MAAAIATGSSCPPRIAVCGVYGAGKTVLARRVAASTGLPFHDYDDVRTADALGRVLASGRWVIAGSERHTDALIWARSDLVVWLDPPLALVLARVVRRAFDREDESGVWDPRNRSRSRFNLLKPWLLVHALRRRRVRRGDFAAARGCGADVLRIGPRQVKALLDALTGSAPVTAAPRGISGRR